jgi:hypothetical protein
MSRVRQGRVWQDRQSESSGPQLCGASTTTIGLRRRYGTWGITWRAATSPSCG